MSGLGLQVRHHSKYENKIRPQIATCEMSYCCKNFDLYLFCSKHRQIDCIQL